jgi:hypothetical protein
LGRATLARAIRIGDGPVDALPLVAARISVGGYESCV